MPVSQTQSSGAYTDIASLQTLKAKGKNGDPEAIKQVAKQFEAIFLQLMLQSMRKTVTPSEEFSNEKAMYYDLFDKQVALEMSDHGGIGMTKMLMAQLGAASKESSEKEQSTELSPAKIFSGQATIPTSSNVSVFSATIDKVTEISKPEAIVKPVAIAAETVSKKNTGLDVDFTSPAEFIRQLWHGASDIIAESGLDPRTIIAQAALETGWGKHVIKKPDGESSNNLFGIKSNNGWLGDKVSATTLEFKDGLMSKAKESFRAYENMLESIKDYVSFISDNTRYKDAVANKENPEQYARELQRAGYATDPDYADKIINIINGKEFRNFFDVSGIKVDG